MQTIYSRVTTLFFGIVSKLSELRHLKRFEWQMLPGRWRLTMFGAVFLLGGAIPNQYFGFHVYSQSSTASLSGSVVDENGALIVGARVTSINLATGEKKLATTNDSGYFVIPFLQPGKYTVKAQRQGFSTTEVKEVELNVSDQVNLRIRLQVGEISESVVIDGADLLIRTESPAVGSVIKLGDPVTELYGDPVIDNLRFGISYKMLGQSMSNPYNATGQPVAGLNPIYQIGEPRSIQLAVKINF